MLRKLLYCFGLFLVCFYGASSVVLANNTYREVSTGETIITQITPISPGPFTTVTISLKSYGADLSKSHVSWYVNKKLIKSGQNNNTFSFQTGAVGEITAINIVVKHQTGQSSEKLLIFDPAEVDLIWQAETYTPPYYTGKALPVPGARVKVAALVYLTNHQGQRLKPERLNYTWKIDGKIINSASGYGQDNFYLLMPENGSAVLVESLITSPEIDIKISKTATIKPSAPQIIFYQNNPLRGINLYQASNYYLSSSKNELSIKAEPYYLASNKNYTYSWLLNNSLVSGQANDPLSTILRAPDDTETTGRLQLRINGLGLVSHALLLKLNQTKQNLFNQ